MTDDIHHKSEDYWKEKLSEEAYRITRKKGTEAPFSGMYWDNHETGMYSCIACGQALFSSDAKFDSGSGWPSFDDPVAREHIALKEDTSHFMKRTEVVCKNCGSHLGHLFPDGPKETTGNRYCINSAALQFAQKK